MLDERKLKVLYAIIESYINSAEPIGSRTITKQYDLGVSPATIRNEMSDLEELGYLNKTHSSSGRIPSDKAYRVYVDRILSERDGLVDKSKILGIKEVLDGEIERIDNFIHNSAKMLSAITKYTSIAVTTGIKITKIRFIKLDLISDEEVLITIINDTGIIKTTIIKFAEPIDAETVHTISQILNKKLIGLTFDEVSNALNEVMHDFYNYKDVIDSIIPHIQSVEDYNKDSNYHYEGLTKLFNYPEYRDFDKAQSILEFLENKDTMLDMLVNNAVLGDVSIIIGNENQYDEIKDCSLICTTYRVGNQMLGQIGIIGPTRMDYSALIDTLSMFSLSISELIGKHIGTK